MSEIIWYSGKNNYLKNTFQFNHPNSINQYTVEALDVEYPPDRNFDEIIEDNLSDRQTKVVEILYSGGMDSECVLQSCLRSNIPVKALTRRMHVNGVTINPSDLYYSEKFCRQNNITQKIIDLDVKKFLDSGEHLKYLRNYKSNNFYAAIQLWNVEQCTGFPVIGGNNFWPAMINNKVVRISPRRYHYFFYDRFFKDNGIHGVSDMLSHSLDINILLMKTQVNVIHEIKPYPSVTHIKHATYTFLGNKIEPRIAGAGWDIWFANMNKEDVTHLLNPSKFNKQLNHLYGETKHKIIWHKKIAGALDIEPGENDNVF